jgi:hypothetical protein
MNGEGFPCKVGGEEPRSTPVGKDTLNRQKFKGKRFKNEITLISSGFMTSRGPLQVGSSAIYRRHNDNVLPNNRHCDELFCAPPHSKHACPYRKIQQYQWDK